MEIIGAFVMVAALILAALIIWIIPEYLEYCEQQRELEEQEKDYDPLD